MNAHTTLTAAALPAAMSVEAAARHCGLGRSTLYGAMRDGTLTATKVGRRTLLRLENLDRWLRTLDAPAPKPKARKS